MSDNQAATVNTIKSKDEFINWLKQNKSFCGLTVTQIGDSECVFNSDNKKAYFKIFLNNNASFQFGVFTGSTPDLKKEFEERLKNAGGQVDGEIKSTSEKGTKPAKIILNSTTFTVGTNQNTDPQGLGLPSHMRYRGQEMSLQQEVPQCSSHRLRMPEP